MSASAARAVSRIATSGFCTSDGVVGERALGRVRLDGDDAHRVGDLVVQLAGDPAALLGHGGPRPLLPLPCASCSASRSSAAGRSRCWRTYSPASIGATASATSPSRLHECTPVRTEPAPEADAEDRGLTREQPAGARRSALPASTGRAAARAAPAPSRGSRRRRPRPRSAAATVTATASGIPAAPGQRQVQTGASSQLTQPARRVAGRWPG